MEFQINIKNVPTEEILKVGHKLVAIGHEENDDLNNCMGKIIDEMGKASAVARDLEVPVTSTEKLINTDHRIYLMTEHDKPGHFTVVGILKMGWKKMFLYDRAGPRFEALVFCLLDFYIHESKQRKGYGKRLFEYMLRDFNVEARRLAFEEPNKKLMQFMWKHFQLTRLVNQGNNIAIYEEIFDDFPNVKNHDNLKNRTTSDLQQSTFGRHEAHKHHDSMGEIVQGQSDAAFVKHQYNHDTQFVETQVKAVNPRPENEGAFQTDKYGN